MQRKSGIFRQEAIIVPITVDIHGIASHPEDDLVLATAISASADYLVTGDALLLSLGFFRDVQISSPRQFLDQLSGLV
jgi:predicted nucleic acid-binding protein